MDWPRIFMNFAISADGKIATAKKGASRFTSRADLDRLLQIRLKADAILVGRGTLEADEMAMTLPPEYQPPKQPLRFIISRKGGFDLSHKVFSSAGGDLHLIATEAEKELPEMDYRKAGATLHRCSLSEFLCYARAKLGVTELLCEGGGSLAKGLFALDAIDEVNLTVASHSLIGGLQAPTITGLPTDFLPTSLAFKLDHWEQNEADELFVRWLRSR